MKRFILLAICTVMISGLCGCGNKDAATSADSTKNAVSSAEGDSANTKASSKNTTTFQLASKTWTVDFGNDLDGKQVSDGYEGEDYILNINQGVTYVNEATPKTEEEYYEQHKPHETEYNYECLYFVYKDNGDTGEYIHIESLTPTENNGLAKLDAELNDEKYVPTPTYYGKRCIVNKSDRSDAVAIAFDTDNEARMKQLKDVLLSVKAN
ncbi:MAG: hypothetical protein J1F64_09885 [Oscillospiraceae bacterium]|nr:hypothetical protein [Oscillospiraceae bacterium]